MRAGNSVFEVLHGQGRTRIVGGIIGFEGRRSANPRLTLINEATGLSETATTAGVLRSCSLVGEFVIAF